ncbi:expressed unknown protein [Seminavis robusta]|uniref:Uncharacterized protein n=1 Tax=Seminavis robusta TaxID=568900 RepID=A0A9N8HKJ3_9STRA|nr:expressed unknown protein [Seminavis robusta]|eukprot:Sro948_g223510.1 n/a (488) ;mRNA; f:12066-13529
MPFQLPTPYTVREYYNQRHPQIPLWFWEYVEFHRQLILFDESKGVWKLRDGSRYLKFSWCQDPLSRKETKGTLHSIFQRLFPFLAKKSTVIPSSACKSDLDLQAYTDGVLTALYVAVMSNRVLMIEDNPLIDTPLYPFLEANLIQWNITEYQQDSAADTVDVLSVTDLSLNEQQLCHIAMSDSLAVQLETRVWLGDTQLWWSPCLKEHRKQVDDQGQSLDRRHFYRWGFWALFRISDDVLGNADRWREATGLAQSEQQPSGLDGRMVHLTFQPYFYAAIPESERSSETLVGREETVRDCAVKLYQVLLPLAIDIQEHGYNDDDAIDDEVKKPILQEVLHRSLYLVGGGVGPRLSAKAVPLHREMTDEETGPSTQKATLPVPRDSHAVVDQGQDTGKGPPHWYQAYWRELVVSAEAECLILAPGESKHERYTESAVLFQAKRLSISHPESTKRCHVSAEECAKETTESLRSNIVLDTVPWTNGATSTE